MPSADAECNKEFANTKKLRPRHGLRCLDDHCSGKSQRISPSSQRLLRCGYLGLKCSM
jgi:hypothetical protein